MKFKVCKTIEAIPMTRREAEMKLNKHIENVLFGDYGYLVGNHWVPKETLEQQAKPIETTGDVTWYAVQTLKDLQSIISTTGVNKKNKTLFKELNNLKELIEQ